MQGRLQHSSIAEGRSSWPSSRTRQSHVGTLRHVPAPHPAPTSPGAASSTSPNNTSVSTGNSSTRTPGMCRTPRPLAPAIYQPYSPSSQTPALGTDCSRTPRSLSAAGATAAAAAAPTEPSSDTAAAAPAAPPVSDESKAVGCLLGAMCGNVLAAPYDGDRHYQIVRARPNGVTDFWAFDIGRQPLQRGQYTGDFANLLAIARSLVDNRGLDSAGALDALVGSYDPELRRYSLYDRTVLDAILAGTAPLTVPQLAERYLVEATRRNASTSSDNLEREPYGPSDYCAAARAAPIGIAYRFAGSQPLLAAVRRSLVFSHATPLGLDAAHVVAAAAAWCARQQPGDSVGCRPEALLAHLINDVAVTADMLGKLRLLRDNLVQVGEVTSWRSFFSGPQWFALTRLLTLLSFHGYATLGSEFVAVALLAFLSSWGRPEQAVIVAASFGGHAAAQTQVVGALCGALYGREWLPARWYDSVEDSAAGGGGRGAVVEVGQALAVTSLAELDPEGGQE